MAEPGIQREAGMTARKRWGALGALLARVGARGRRAAGTGVGGSTTNAAGADRDRLGVRQQGQHGAVRRPGARGGEGPRSGRSTRGAASTAGR